MQPVGYNDGFPLSNCFQIQSYHLELKTVFGACKQPNTRFLFFLNIDDKVPIDIKPRLSKLLVNKMNWLQTSSKLLVREGSLKTKFWLCDLGL